MECFSIRLLGQKMVRKRFIGNEKSYENSQLYFLTPPPPIEFELLVHYLNNWVPNNGIRFDIWSDLDG